MTTKGRVLYCEDHDDTRILITMMPERAGFQVTAASSGTECLRLAEGEGASICTCWIILSRTRPA